MFFGLAERTLVPTDIKVEKIDESTLKMNDSDWPEYVEINISPDEKLGWGCPFKTCDTVLTCKASLKDHFRNIHNRDELLNNVSI